MRKIIYLVFIFGMVLFSCSDNNSPQEDEMPPVTPEQPEQPSEPENPDAYISKLPRLSVQGKYLKNESGKVVNLHGFTQTYSPYFNNNAWSGYDVQGCLEYNKKMVDGILAAGWKMNFVRMHLDPYWSDDPSKQSVRYEGHERFNETRFKKYLDELFIPMAKYFVSKGFYVVMRPPGVCPDNQEKPDGTKYQGIAVGDSYHTFLKRVWGILSQNDYIKNNTDIMFELANEPVAILGTDGNYAHWTDGAFQSATKFFQEVIEVIRNNGCTANVIWVPGLCWQQQYKGYAKYRLKDNNMGFAVHCYPGWYGSDCEESTGEGGGSAWKPTSRGYESFKKGWDENVGCVAEFAPIMVTEIDWAPAKYDATWGKGSTGTAGGLGFGANFKKIADESGNVSWLFFTTRSHELASFKDVHGTEGNYTFLNDPEACPWAIYHWFKEYAEAE